MYVFCLSCPDSATFALQHGSFVPREWLAAKGLLPGGGGGTPIHYLYGYVRLNGVVILKLLILKGVSISEAFSRTGYKKLWIAALSSA